MVDLSALPTGRDGDDQAVAHAARAALRLPEQSACSPTSTLVEGLRERRLLLVLDNCEHVLPACASLVYSVLTACPAIRILATSRETLGVAGERPWSVPTLSQPDTDAPLEQMAAAEAVRLFLARARLRQPSLVLTAENAGALAAICRQLDGLPLALELAAARVGVLSLDGIATRLGESLHLLTGGPRSAPSRQRTLRATLDWSHDLLGEPERRLLRRLAVFAGGFTLEAGQAVCGEEQVMAASILEELTELVQKSLVMADNLSQTPRLSEGRRLLEAILVSRGAISTEARAALLDSACSLAYLQGDFARALALAEEGLDLRRRMGDRRGLAQALNTRGNVAWFMTEYSLAARLYEESLALFRETDDQEGLANALNNRAMVASVQGQFARAAAVYGECRGILRGLGNTASLAQVLMNLGISLHEQGNYEQADRLYQECLSQCREMGNQQIVLRVMNWLAISALEQGNEAKATRLFEECLGLAEALNDADEVGRTHHYLGVIALAQGEYGRAEDIFLESLALRRQRRQTYGIAANLERLGQLRAAVGQPVAAARLLGAAEGRRASINIPIPPREQPPHDWTTATLRSSLGDAAFSEAWYEGRAMDLDALIAGEITLTRHSPGGLDRSPVSPPAGPPEIDAAPDEKKQPIGQ
jgi:tetratricopeptide (TPR) repeat protein